MSGTGGESSGGVGVLGLLGVVFVVLKLCGVIGWSWLWVTLPFWGGFALAVPLMAIYFGVVLYERWEARRRRKARSSR